MSSSLVLCTVECLTPGNRTVEVSNNGLDYRSQGVPIECFSAPSILTMSPKEGPVDGGTAVTILLQRPLWAFGRISVVFGSKLRSARCVYAHPGQYRCATPPAVGPGQVRIHLAFDGAPMPSSNPVYFLYTHSCRVVSILPSSGPGQGGVAVAAVGEHFSLSRTLCKFGSSPRSQGTVFSSTYMLCVLPASKAASVQVTASTNGADWALPGSLFA